MAAVKVTIKNTRKFKASLAFYDKRVLQAVKRHLFQEAEGIMTVAKDLVPVDTGTLRSSGHVEPPKMAGGSVVVELGFGGPSANYAIRVHEDMQAQHTVGFAKYLEAPYRNAIKGMAGRLSAAVKRATK